MNRRLVILLACFALLPANAALGAEKAPTKKDVNELEKKVERQDQVIRDLEQRLDQLEAPPPAAKRVDPDKARSAEEVEAEMYPQTQQSPVENRGTFEDRQEAAARPGNLVLDPKYRGFIPIPQTVFMVKFNPKPRLDLMWTTRNPGDSRYRFAPALFPIDNTTEYDAGSQFDAGANGSQIRVDLRAPALGGNFRLYYQNDFFGSDSSDFQFRLQHFYGQAYGIVGGFTYGIFEDPDAWPDTVDYEGPNAVIFARRALLHYTLGLPANFFLTLGLEDPKAFINTTGDPNAESKFRAPDGGFNVRWEPGDLGHIQFSSIFRSLGIQGDIVDDQDVFGWGLNLAGSINITPNNTFQFYGVYGQGVGGLGNDAGFDDSDAALDGDGDLVALDYVSGMLAFTHVWTPRWRSTATYGYVNVENTGMQADDAYDYTHYASANLIYKIFKRLSVGGEVLYGFRNVKSGDDGDVVRFQMSFVYAPFD